MTSPSLNKEREAFEAWRRRTAKTANPDKAVALNGFGDDAQYDVPATRAMWAAWQARAAIVGTPSKEGAGQVEADWAQAIVDLSAGWDDKGSTGPKSPMSWETVARLAMDYARAAIQSQGAKP